MAGTTGVNARASRSHTLEWEENPMKAILTGLLALSCLGELATSPRGPTENDYKAVFAKHWQLSFGQLMFHIAAQNSDSCSDAAGTKPLAELGSSKLVPPATDRQTAIRVLNLAFDKCAREIDGMPPEQWNKEVYKFRGQPVLAYEALWYTFTHTAHHRAQAE